jgi:hypothetical protein
MVRAFSALPGPTLPPAVPVAKHFKTPADRPTPKAAPPETKKPGTVAGQPLACDENGGRRER